ncbi:hypothetical protein DCC85_21580 [Paenibacillus sp. CAA11]|uniref:hypothetical protein n=1 Tax=Paenibacillus sp. CAA11 TaxID=1532905 RepID=UPI000D3A39C1|nr:hypothetical protein [Paenibacillus sp. CAA11]AWB46502.1 hypothetical protein DCC85_21580 [Paenibacillus sp. CAA11]
MKKTAALLAGALLVGSMGYSSAAAAQSSPNPSPRISAAITGSVPNTALYQPVKYKFTKAVSQSAVTWKGNQLTLMALKTVANSEEVVNPEQKVLGSMNLTYGDKKFTIPFSERPVDIRSLSLSASKDYLAVSAEYSAGSKLYIVNLSTGKFVILNDVLEAKGKGFVESVSAFNWAPSGSQLAFAYGDTSESYPALYDAKTGKLTSIYSKVKYISTAAVLWHKNGKGFDFISESPSDRFKLYRYSVGGAIKAVKTIERNDMAKWLKFDSKQA